MPLGVCHTCHRGFILESQTEIAAPDCPGCGALLELRRLGKPQDLPRVPLALRRAVSPSVPPECREGAAVS